MISLDLICDIACDRCGKKQGARVEAKNVLVSSPTTDVGTIEGYSHKLRDQVLDRLASMSIDGWATVDIRKKRLLCCPECLLAAGLVENPAANITCSRCGTKGHAAGSCKTDMTPDFPPGS